MEYNTFNADGEYITVKKSLKDLMPELFNMSLTTLMEILITDKRAR